MINKRIMALRVVSYLIGILVLAIGLTLNTNVELGVAPIMSVPYSASKIWHVNYGDATFVVYMVLVAIEVIIHVYLKRYRLIAIDVGQIAFSLVFTRFLNIFKAMIPDFGTDLSGTIWGTMPMRMAFLFLGIVLTGIGAAMMLNARMVPNPADGLVQAVADLIGKDVGFVKNCTDAVCVTITIVMSMVTIHGIVGVGIGTVLSLLGVGRVIAIYNKLVSPAEPKPLEED